MGVVEVLTAGIKLWAEVRGTIDPHIRQQWDLLFLADYVELRKRVGMPLPAGLDLAALTEKKEG